MKNLTIKNVDKLGNFNKQSNQQLLQTYIHRIAGRCRNNSYNLFYPFTLLLERIVMAHKSWLFFVGTASFFLFSTKRVWIIEELSLQLAIRPPRKNSFSRRYRLETVSPFRVDHSSNNSCTLMNYSPSFFSSIYLPWLTIYKI